MKTKIFLIVVAVCFVFSLSSCGESGKKDVTGNNESKNILEKTSENSKEQKIEVEKLSLMTDSIDELIDHVKRAKAGVDEEDPYCIIYRNNNIAQIDGLIHPSDIMSGYKLYKIEVTDLRIFYYYVPADLNIKSDTLVDPDITVTVCRVKDPNGHPLNTLEKHLSVEREENGLLYDVNHDSIFMEFDSVWIMFRMSENKIDYDALEKMCAVKKIEIE